MIKRLSIVIGIFCTSVYCLAQQAKEPQKITRIDNNIRHLAKENMRFISDRMFSQIKTALYVEYYTNDKQTDTFDQKDYSLISWYHQLRDTINLVAHINDFETEALLLKIFRDTIIVRFFRCSHSTTKIFSLHRKGKLSACIEVPARKFNLIISEIPDTLSKQVIFGYIDLESDHFYQERHHKDRKRTRTSMKFFFRSQFRRFTYEK